MLDQRWHQLPADQVPAGRDVWRSRRPRKKDGIDFAPVPPRYRTPYFSHIMGGYSAGYYAYIWSEVLDADSVEWFKQNGGLTRKNGDHFRATLVVAGGKRGLAAVPRLRWLASRRSSRCSRSVVWTRRCGRCRCRRR